MIEQIKQSQKKDPEKLRNYMREYLSRPDVKTREAQRRREKRLQNYEQYRQREKERASTPQSRARQTFRNALYSGKIIKPSNCTFCGIDSDIEAHHEDYSKPLEVKWLCRSCHKKIHRKYAD